MIHHVLVSGSRPAVERLAPRLAEAIEATSIAEGVRETWTAGSGTWAAAGLSTNDPTCNERVAVSPSGDGIAIVNGPALAASGTQAGMVAGVLAAYERAGAPGVDGAIGGNYNVVAVTPERGLSAFTDFSGTFPLFWARSGDATVVSNRSTTVRHVIGGHGWDERALTWVLGHANVFGDAVPARGVSYLLPGTELFARFGDGAAHLRRSPGWVWPDPDREVRGDNLPSEEWDAITDALVANFRALGTIDWPFRLLLTGGKDSRLVLALAKAAGLGGRFRTVTMGRPDSPEVECARAVATAAGFEHERIGVAGSTPAPAPAPGTEPVPPPFDAAPVWKRIEQHVGRNEAIVCPWDGLTNPLTMISVDIKGFGGEFFKRWHPPKFQREPIETVEQMAEMFVHFHQRHDPLNVLRPDIREWQAGWMRSWVRDAVREVPLEVLPERFYVQYRLGLWNGPLGQNKPGRIHINPLLLSRACRANLELPVELRQQERFHFEVMRRAAPELVTVPFLGDTWHPSLVEDAPAPLPTEPFKTQVPVSLQVLKTWQWRFLETQGERLEQLFADAEEQTAMGEVVRMPRLRKLAADSATIQQGSRGKEMVSAVAMATALLGRERRVQDRPGLPPRDDTGPHADERAGTA